MQSQHTSTANTFRSASSSAKLESFCKFVFATCLWIAIASLLAITMYILWNGLRLFGSIPWSNFLLGLDWQPLDGKSFGILPMIITSLYVTLLSVLLSAPVGVSCAIFAAQLATGKLKEVIQAAIQVLAGTPSVVYGLLGLSVLVPWVQAVGKGTGFSILTAVLILTVMILPTIISISQDAIQSVPQELKQASLALGATNWQTIFRVVLPRARAGIVTSIVLAIGRAFGEAMAVKMVIGNRQTLPDFSSESWFGLLSTARTLTTNIVGDIEYAREGPHLQSLFATGAVLFVIIMLVNYIAHIVIRPTNK